MRTHIRVLFHVSNVKTSGFVFFVLHTHRKGCLGDNCPNILPTKVQIEQCDFFPCVEAALAARSTSLCSKSTFQIISKSQILFPSSYSMPVSQICETKQMCVFKLFLCVREVKTKKSFSTEHESNNFRTINTSVKSYTRAAQNSSPNENTLCTPRSCTSLEMSISKKFVVGKVSNTINAAKFDQCRVQRDHEDSCHMIRTRGKNLQEACLCTFANETSYPKTRHLFGARIFLKRGSIQRWDRDLSEAGPVLTKPWISPELGFFFSRQNLLVI